MRRFPLIRKYEEPLLAGFDFGKMFENFFSAPFKPGLGIETTPTVDIYEQDNKVVATVEIPGVKPGDVKLSVEGNILTIAGEKKVQSEVKKENYCRIERSCGKFQRMVELPADVKAEQSKATYNNGVLKIELPKSETQRKKEIKIDIK